MLPSQGCGTVTGAGVHERVWMGVCVCGRGARQETRKGIGRVDRTRQVAWQVWTGMAVVRRLRLWQLRAPPADMKGRGIMRCARGYPGPR